jgi:guanine deaminase
LGAGLEVGSGAGLGVGLEAGSRTGATTEPAANFILKGDIVYSLSPTQLHTATDSYVICEGGVSRGVFDEIPGEYGDFPLHDYSGHLITPGFIDLHTHAPQYPFRGQGMDLELLEWLNTHTFPEEARYGDVDYARHAYGIFVNRLKKSVTTRALIFATVHLPSSLELMDLLESSGLITSVGKVNMDRNTIAELEEASAAESLNRTREWLDEVAARAYQRTEPILTPRFIPSCSSELLLGLSALQQEYQLPVQSHLSENHAEIEWVKELCPESNCYADAYLQHGLLGGEGAPTVMAHCVHSDELERKLLKDQGVWVAHCPESNTCLASGIAPVRKFLIEGARVGLGTDVAGGFSLSMLHTIAETVKVSKLYWRLIDESAPPLTIPEAFFLATQGGGSLWGKVGSLEAGYEFDAVIFDEGLDATGERPTIENRLERLVYLDEQNKVLAKYVAGKKTCL